MFDSALAEASYREKVGLLAYSPLAFGFLSGKYLQSDPGVTRITLFENFGQRYLKPRVNEAIAAYAEVAQRHRLSLTALALTFVRSRWFVTSTIIGATTLEQLQENLDSINVVLNQDVLKDIDAVYTQYPNPAP